MKVAITGASGNVGTSVLEALSTDPDISEIVGIARRKPTLEVPKTSWVAADVASTDLIDVFKGADVVVHLAWLIQPSRDEGELFRVNVPGSKLVFDAAAAAGVGAIVYASSLGAYSPGPKDRLVDESWPVEGIPTSFYARHKAEVESILDAFEQKHPQIRVVRLRPALIFKADAATGVRRLFAGPLLPGRLLRKPYVPLVPTVQGLRFQAVHSRDVGEAYRQAIKRDVRGAFNLAADPVLDLPTVARLLGTTRTLQVSPGFVRAGASLSWKLRLQPTPPGWVDMALNAPLMDSTRARTELGWQPRYSSIDALDDLLRGLREGTDYPTPPLSSSTTNPLRVREFATGIGAKGGVD
jgi:UDP-glucose 4-epimerase